MTDSSAQTIGLQVQPGKTLVLVGGNVSLDGGIVNASSGRVELGGVSQPGTLGLNIDGNMISLIFPNGVNRASVLLKNAAVVDVSGDGSGSIAINARNLDILGQSNLKADVFQFDTPIPRVGDITLNATEAINIKQSSRVESAVWSNNVTSYRRDNATLHGSDINITTGSLLISNGSLLNPSTEGILNAGNVNINASNISFDGKDSNGDLSGIVNLVYKSKSDGDGNTNISIPKSTANGGNISINTETLSLTNGGTVEVFTSGQGATGIVTINASDSVSLDGFGSGVYTISYNKDFTVNSGGINITTGKLSVTNEAELNTGIGAGNARDINIISGDVSLDKSSVSSTVRSSGTGNGGNIFLKIGDSLFVTNGAQVSTSTDASGNAGNLYALVGNSVDLSGTSADGKFASGLRSNVGLTGVGNGGNLNLATRRLVIRDGAEITVGNRGRGNAGNLNVNAQSISLNNQGKLTANSVKGEGGNISLGVEDFLLMHHNSVIKNTSGTAQAGGNGGNFRLATKFLVASNFENNDIITNAFNGSGGNIRINAYGVFGFVIRSREDLEKLRPNDLDPRQLPTNDISAFSQTGKSFIPNQEDFTRVLVLPTGLDVSNRLINATCTASDNNSFIVTGRGGLPPSPDEPLSSDVVWSDTRQPTTIRQQVREKPIAKLPAKSESELVAIIPATGWVFNGNNEVTLISKNSNAASLGSTSARCPRL